MNKFTLIEKIYLEESEAKCLHVLITPKPSKRTQR